MKTFAKVFLEPTNPSDVINVISELKSGSGTAPIPLKFIKLSIHEISQLITVAFNDMLRTGTYPDILKVARVVPIFKSGSHKDISNYRPISILPIFDKIFEKLLFSRINSFFLE